MNVCTKIQKCINSHLLTTYFKLPVVRHVPSKTDPISVDKCILKPVMTSHCKLKIEHLQPGCFQNSDIFKCNTVRNLIWKDSSLKSITEPPLTQITCIELPMSSLRIKDFQLPPIDERELVDPVGTVIEKKAHRMLIIRRKKMNKHKYKKRQKRMKFVFRKLHKKKRSKKNALFKKKMYSLLEASDSFSAESYLEEQLANLNWKHPVTTVKGRLAPDWVIKEFVDEKIRKKKLGERVQYCLQKQM